MKTINQQAHDEYYEMYDGLSDMDYSFNSETGEFDIPSVEWDGPYGRHWSRYESEEARSKALNDHTAHMEKWIADREKEIIAEKEAAIAERLAGDNTLGNLFPQLKALQF